MFPENFLSFAVLNNPTIIWSMILYQIFEYVKNNIADWKDWILSYWDINAKLVTIRDQRGNDRNTLFHKLGWYVTQLVFRENDEITVENNGILNYRNEKKPILANTIYPEIYYNFTYHGYKLSAYRTIQTFKNGNSEYSKEYITLKGANNSILNELCQEAIVEYDKEREKRRGIIHKLDNDFGWIIYNINVNKTQKNLFLPADIEKKIFNTAKYFIENPDFYRENGLAYKLSFLLHGIPGTGKSSIVYALANELDRNIYSVSMKDVNQQNFDSFINTIRQIPSESIILFDDADIYFKKYKRKNLEDNENEDIKIQEQQKTNLIPADWGEDIEFVPLTDKENEQILNSANLIRKSGYQLMEMLKEDIKKSKYEDSKKKILSSMLRNDSNEQLAQLLEFFDGYTSLNNTIVVMTTNDISAFDPALIRPGRMDQIIEFGPATEEQVRAAFKHYYKREDLDFYDSDKTISYIINTAIIPNIGAPKTAYDLIYDQN